MKTKNKGITILGLSVLLCSLFLVTISVTAIAAEQDDYVLGIYGNANEDDTIDMRDLTYVKLIFFGKKPETELADAKYDGEINPLDFIQIKRIIVGKEKELTFVDSADRIVTVKKPVKRIVVSMPPNAEAIRILDATDKVVGVSDLIASKGGTYKNYEIFFPELSKLPTAGFALEDYEAVLNLYPDVVLHYGCWGVTELEEHLPGITVIGLDFINIKHMKEDIEKLGYVLDKRDEAEVFVDWYEGCLNTINDRTKELSDDEKPRMYFGTAQNLYNTYTKQGLGPFDDLCVIAGGRNIAADLPFGYGIVDPEWVIEQNPDIIIIATWPSVLAGYPTNDPSGMKEVRDSVMNRPELANVKAVKNGRVYVIDYDIWASPAVCSVAPPYYAKWFHPILFEDLDPKAVHQEYITRFQGLDYDSDKNGVFVYPPLE